MAASIEALIPEFASTPTPPSPPPLLKIPSPPLHVLSLLLPLPSPPTHISPTYADAPLGYKAGMIRSRAASPPLVPSPPLLLPSTAHRDDITEADMPLRKRARFSAPAFGFEVGRDRVMTAIGEVNERVTNLAATQRQDAYALYVRSWSHSKDRSTALEASIRTLEAHVRTLQTQHDRMEWQRQQVGDMLTSAFGRIHALEARD
ncbi:hypothetical protein Tco_0285283 [Tanacetum coccineum]